MLVLAHATLLLLQLIHYIVLLVSRIRGAGYVVQYGYSKNTRTTREACEASTNSVLLLLIGLIR